MRSISLVIVLALCLSSNAAASTVRYLSDAELIARSERVVHGRVIAQRTTRGGPSGRSISTVTTIAVIEDLTGVEGDTVEVTELGGTIGRESMRVAGAVQFELGAEVVVCLGRGARGLHSVGMGLSRFDLQPAADGVTRLVRRLGDTMVVGAPATSAAPSLEAFRNLARQVTGRASRPGRTPNAPVTRTRRAPEAFTFFGGGSPAFSGDGSRWAKADAGLPVGYYINSNATSPIAPSDPTASIQAALAAWTNPADASLILQYSGITTQPFSEGPWNHTIPPDSVVISFEDPDDEIDDPTLAITINFVTDGAGGTLHGTTFDGLVDSAIKFQNAADLSSGFRQPLDFARVLTHEIGHTIGLGHTQADGTVVNPKSNIMYASCCYSSTPTPPALGPDDLDGLVFLYPADGACQYAVSPSSASYPPGGGSGNLVLATYAQCGWTAGSSAGFAAVTSAASGVGSVLLFYNVAANTGAMRSATITVGGRPVTITQSAALPAMTLDKSSLTFAAVTSGGGFTSQTSTQPVRLTASGAGTVTWTTTPTQPWLDVTPATGSGSGTLLVSVHSSGGLPPSGTLTGSVIVSYNGASTATGVIAVTLQLTPTVSVAPFGVVDTPLDNSAGVTGAVPFTGWALDDVEVAAVSVCRDGVAAESVSADGRCGGNAQIYVSDAVFIDGARPDVQVGYPTYPRNRQAGWGVMVLTNMLPNQGNGTYRFSIYARDAEGHSTLLGTRTMTCDNAHALLPFGTIDTPAQGEIVSGSAYVNFGWALTPNPKAIPVDGSTVTVHVDGVAVGSASYNHYRSDIATLFPGLANTSGAVGFRVLDTTTLTNGLHTIVWTATDTANATEGLGSRYFTVSNGSLNGVAAPRRDDAVAASPPVLEAGAVDTLALTTTAISGRRGWTPGARWHSYAPDASGLVALRGEELDRLELRLGDGAAERHTGYLRVGRALAPLPIGARLDETTGAFTWSPGVGFVGRYDLVFVRWVGDRPMSRSDVRIILRPKGTGQIGPQVVIDTPTPQQDVGQPFVLAGWAADLDSGEGTGIDTLHVWAYPLTGGRPLFLGTAASGSARPDVAAVYGDQFRDAGYGLIVQGLTPGNYDLAVFAWSRVRGGFVPATQVRVTVR